jgi:hypothetical protein
LGVFQNEVLGIRYKKVKHYGCVPDVAVLIALRIGETLDIWLYMALNR